jgi:hypothetical protein
MNDDLMIWTTVGSAGMLSAADLAEVSLDKAVITLGQGIAPPPAGAVEDPSSGFPTTSVVVRYNVTPVAGLFPAGRFHYVLANASSTAANSGLLDFVRCAYYVEATLTAPAAGVGNPAAIAAVKILASPDFSG